MADAVPTTVVRSFPATIGVSAPDKPVVFIASTSGIKRDNSEIVQSGWKLDEYRKNPVILFGHNDTKTPVGKASRVWVDNDRLMVEVEWASAIDGFSATVEQMVRKGFLNAVSVRWLPLDWETLPNGSVRYNSQELLEISVCPVPADASALAVQRELGTEKKEEPMADDTKTVDQGAAILSALDKMNERMAKIESELDKPAIDTAAQARGATAQAPVIAKFATPRAMKGREERGNARDPKGGKGLELARYALASYHANERGMPIADAAVALGWDKTAELIDSSQRAQLEGTLTAGGVLVQEQIYAGFADYLKDQVVVRNALVPNSHQIVLSGESVSIPKLASGLTWSWIANENASASNTSLVFGQETMRVKTGAAECIFSLDLLRDASSNIESIVRDELAYAAARGEDIALMEGSGAAYEPKGIKNWTASANKSAQTNTSSATYLDADADLLKALKTMSNNKVQGPYVFIGCDTHRFGLMGLADSSDRFPLREELKNGVLLGTPAVFSTALTTGTSSIFYLVAPRYNYFAEKMAPEIVADDKYVDSNGTSHALSPKRMGVLRLFRKFDFAQVGGSGLESYQITSVYWGS